MSRQADLSVKNICGETVVMVAVWEGYDDILQLLLDQGESRGKGYQEGLVLEAVSRGQNRSGRSTAVDSKCRHCQVTLAHELCEEPF